MGYVKSSVEGKVPVTSMLQKNSYLSNIDSEFNKPLKIDKQYESKQTHHRKDISVMDHVSEYERLANDTTTEVCHTRNYMHTQARDPKTYTIGEDVRFETQAPVSMLPLSRQKRENTNVYENRQETKQLLESDSNYENYVQESIQPTVTSVQSFTKQPEIDVNVNNHTDYTQVSYVTTSDQPISRIEINRTVYKNPIDTVIQQGHGNHHVVHNAQISDVHLRDKLQQTYMTNQELSQQLQNTNSDVKLGGENISKQQFGVNYASNKQLNINDHGGSEINLNNDGNKSYLINHHLSSKHTLHSDQNVYPNEGMNVNLQTRINYNKDDNASKNHTAVKQLDITSGGRITTNQIRRNKEFVFSENNMRQLNDSMKTSARTLRDNSAKLTTHHDSLVYLEEPKTTQIPINTNKSTFIPNQNLKHSDVNPSVFKDGVFHAISTVKIDRGNNKASSASNHTTTRPNPQKLYSVPIHTKENHNLQKASYSFDNDMYNKQNINAYIQTDTQQLNTNSTMDVNVQHHTKEHNQVPLFTNPEYHKNKTSRKESVILNTNKKSSEITYHNDKRFHTKTNDTHASRINSKLKDKHEIEYTSNKRTLPVSTAQSQIKLRDTTPSASYTSRGFIDLF